MGSVALKGLSPRAAANTDGAIGIQPLVPLVAGTPGRSKKRLFSDETFTVDVTLIQAWAGQKNFSARAAIRSY